MTRRNSSRAIRLASSKGFPWIFETKSPSIFKSALRIAWPAAVNIDRTAARDTSSPRSMAKASSAFSDWAKTKRRRPRRRASVEEEAGAGSGLSESHQSAAAVLVIGIPAVL